MGGFANSAMRSIALLATSTSLAEAFDSLDQGFGGDAEVIPELVVAFCRCDARVDDADVISRGIGWDRRHDVGKTTEPGGCVSDQAVFNGNNTGWIALHECFELAFVEGQGIDDVNVYWDAAGREGLTSLDGNGSGGTKGENGESGFLALANGGDGLEGVVCSPNGRTIAFGERGQVVAGDTDDVGAVAGGPCRGWQ